MEPVATASRTSAPLAVTSRSQNVSVASLSASSGTGTSTSAVKSPAAMVTVPDTSAKSCPGTAPVAPANASASAR